MCSFPGPHPSRPMNWVPGAGGHQTTASQIWGSTQRGYRHPAAWEGEWRGSLSGTKGASSTVMKMSNGQSTVSAREKRWCRVGDENRPTGSATRSGAASPAKSYVVPTRGSGRLRCPWRGIERPGRVLSEEILGRLVDVVWLGWDPRGGSQAESVGRGGVPSRVSQAMAMEMCA